MFIPGKIPYIKTVSLDIQLEVGSTIDYVHWIPYNQQKNTENYYPYNFKFKIIFDDQVLFNYYMCPGQKSIHHNFVDTDHTADHKLSFVLTNLNNTYGIYAPMLRIHVWIEGLNLTRYLSDHGTGVYYDLSDEPFIAGDMGRNGEQSIVLQTPIYPWLLENDQDSDYYL
jgi:hypothetical protein